MKTIIFQLRTENEKSIVNITKVDTWLYSVIEKSTFVKSMKIFAKAGPKVLPIATPTNCLCI